MRRLLALATATALVLAPAPALATPGPPNAPEYWFDSWQLERLWAAGVRGQGVVIAEIDTGVNAAVPELAGQVLPGMDFGRPGNGQVDREVDEFGHGTAMASIMVAHAGLFDITGVAPGAKIMPIAVPLDGTTDRGSSDQLPKAITWAADHGADVISMSIGGKRVEGQDGSPCPADEQAAVFHAIRRGAVVVASVGNTGPKANTVEEPGACLGVVSVGAVDAAGQVARFSGRVPYLTMVAPGVSVPSLSRVIGTAYSGDGTSQAAAIASAVFALVRSRYPNLSPRDVVTRVLATLDGHRDTPSRDYGYGQLDAYRAVTADVPAGTANPVFDRAEPFLARDSAYLQARSPAPPPPAVTGSVPTGTYEVGTVARVTSQVRTGIAIAAAGLLALLVLLVVGVRRRRMRARYVPATAAAPPPMASWPAVPPQPRPRPRPHPHPGPGRSPDDPDPDPDPGPAMISGNHLDLESSPRDHRGWSGAAAGGAVQGADDAEQ